MRVLFILAMLYLCSPAMAQEWDRYVNERYGTVMSIPPGYTVEMESDDGDGRLFVSSDKQESLLVWGSHLIDETLQQHYELQMSYDGQLGWDIVYKAKGNGWRVYSGLKDDRIIYAKILAACDGRQAQHFKFEYALSKKAALDKLVVSLSKSLKSRKGLDCH